ncbi:terminase small subunit [Nodosilinea sp. AN01ver1]|uniref:terminase small subunit n=1 Tax=Nodosilinea sp. AN01ver1 TaxID=3423362 RepID=UPI003D31CD3C
MATDPAAQNVSDRQAQFCREYLRMNNAAGAYQSIYGCSTKAAESGASRMLRSAKVQSYLAQLRQTTSQAANVTLERTLEEIGAIAFSNITDALTWGPHGVQVKPSDTLPPEVQRAVESITDSGGRKTVKMHSKMQALGMLAKYFGLDDDFNSARQCLKRYGLALVEDSENPTGWSVRPYEG